MSTKIDRNWSPTLNPIELASLLDFVGFTRNKAQFDREELRFLANRTLLARAVRKAMMKKESLPDLQNKNHSDTIRHEFGEIVRDQITGEFNLTEDLLTKSGKRSVIWRLSPRVHGEVNLEAFSQKDGKIVRQCWGFHDDSVGPTDYESQLVLGDNAKEVHNWDSEIHGANFERISGGKSTPFSVTRCIDRVETYRGDVLWSVQTPINASLVQLEFPAIKRGIQYTFGWGNDDVPTRISRMRDGAYQGNNGFHRISEE